MITFGSDPEFMLMKDGKYYSAVGVVHGDRDRRIKKRGHEFYYDNVMAECAVRPSKSKRAAVDSIRECLKLYADLVAPYQLVAQASQNYSNEQIELMSDLCNPEEGPPGRVSGCDPERCAYYAGKLFKPPKEAFDAGTFRTCGGHIHLGGTGKSILLGDDEKPLVVVLLLDVFLGIPSLFWDTDPTSPARRALFGKAGRYRSPDYGIEYRSLGNFWLRSPETVGLVHDICNWVVNLVTKEGEKWWELDEDLFYDADDKSEAWTCHQYDPWELKRCIDETDLDAAHPFLEMALSHFPSKICRALHAEMDRKPPDLYCSWGIS